MAFQPEKPGPGEPERPTVDTVQADMGKVRRRFWLAAALRHLGEGAVIQDAEDVLQEFIVGNVPAVCQQYTPARSSFQTYLWKSFEYYCWRQGKRERARQFGQEPLESADGDGSVEIRIADERAQTPLQLAEVREQALILTNALAELTELQRRCWISVNVHHLSYVEAAARIGVSDETITVELHRARHRISELIHHYPRTFLSVGEVRDWAGLCKGLCQDAEHPLRSVGKRVWELGTDTLRTLASHSSQDVSAQAQADLVRELNLVLGRLDFYSSQDVGRITPGKFTREIHSLVRRKTGPITARRLNKLLFRNHYDRYFLQDT